MLKNKKHLPLSPMFNMWALHYWRTGKTHANFTKEILDVQTLKPLNEIIIYKFQKNRKK